MNKISLRVLREGAPRGIVVREDELLALVEAVEAAHRVTTVGRDASHDTARAVYAEDLMHALARFDFGGDA